MKKGICFITRTLVLPAWLSPDDQLRPYAGTGCMELTLKPRGQKLSTPNNPILLPTIKLKLEKKHSPKQMGGGL